MSASTPLEKRIKRHVSGRVHEFFVAAAPGLERLCGDEMLALPLSDPHMQVVDGGVDFKGRLADCYMANLHLKTANRILMRIGSFKATNFRQLEKRIAAFPWELYFKAGVVLQVRTALHQCRLFHTNAVSDRFKIVIEKHLKEHGMTTQDDVPQRLFVRGQKDRFGLSVDSSGALLHKRGMKKDVGPAPIRETLAAAVLTLAGYDGQETLLDPMCGSGTFSIEAALRAQHIPAGWQRAFAFMDWPGFRPRQWEYIRKKAEAKIRRMEKPRIFAHDADQRTCDVLAKRIQAIGLSNAVTVSQQDFFNYPVPKHIGPPGLIVFNPPYGRRIGSPRQMEAFYLMLYQRLQSHFAGWKLALLVPRKSWADMAPFKMKVQPLRHGGLSLRLLFGRIPFV